MFGSNSALKIKYRDFCVPGRSNIGSECSRHIGGECSRQMRYRGYVSPADQSAIVRSMPPKRNYCKEYATMRQARARARAHARERERERDSLALGCGARKTREVIVERDRRQLVVRRLGF
jgi:hypothetical protein